MEKEMIIIQGVINTLAFGGLILFLLGFQIVYMILPVISMLLSGFAIYYSKLVKDAEIVVVKDNIRAKFYYTISNNFFSGGSLNINLLFYNRGDKESIVYIDDLEIQNLDCSWITRPSEHTDTEFLIIKPRSPLEIKTEARFNAKEPTSEETISSIDKIQLKYHWIKKERINPCVEEVRILCETIKTKE